MDNIGNYRAFLLRMWSVEQFGQKEWRASLEDPHTGDRLGFPNVEALMAYMRELTDSSLDEEGNIPNDGTLSAENLKRPE